MTINIGGNLIDLHIPRVMGIVNVTPDSFYSKSRTSRQGLLAKVSQMLSEGADFIDIGGYSSRPGAAEVSEKEELERVVSAVELLVKEFPNISISVDTFRSVVADESLKAGAVMINDISAGRLDARMWEVVARHQVPYIAMHMVGNPQTMMQHTHYNNLLRDMAMYFAHCKQKAQEYGINDLLIDPGFGFSKTLEQNYELLQNLSYLQILECPILVGVSRKSMFYKLLQTTPEQALNATTAAHAIALQKGASILRVHDVKEAVEVVKIHQKISQFPTIKIDKKVILNTQNLNENS